RDVAKFAWRALDGYRTRTLLMVLAMSIGVAAVVVLTSLGEGARRYVRNEFESLGTNLIIILPGRAETVSGSAGMMSGRTARDLTLEDALALRRIRGVERVAPLNLVSGEVWANGRRRDVPVAGSTSELTFIWGLSMASGRFLPPQDARRAASICVIGSKVRRELFGAESPLGQWLRLGDRRFRVIGVLAPKGEFVGLNMDDLVIIPVASAQVTYNLTSLLRIGVMTRAREDVPRAKEAIRRALGERHGEEDVTILTQDAVSAAFDKILIALTFALGGIAAISLAVAGILIMNVMLIAVAQRTREIGLLKAIGASARQIRFLFFAEAAVLSAIGAIAGSLLGQLGSFVIRSVYPSIPAFAPGWAVVASVLIALATGVLFTVAPARRAAALEAALALR
ncbi:MAG TPA: ABC transporter permease, partial [Thermoanaerobaculia bacterium]|nr:ABC transporter permease [Thermoanaerobaculia bacterium]